VLELVASTDRIECTADTLDRLVVEVSPQRAPIPAIGSYQEIAVPLQVRAEAPQVSWIGAMPRPIPRVKRPPVRLCTVCTMPAVTRTWRVLW
jgi:hypothetical protein